MRLLTANYNNNISPPPLSHTLQLKLPSGINFWEINLFMEITIMTRTAEATAMSIIFSVTRLLR